MRKTHFAETPTLNGWRDLGRHDLMDGLAPPIVHSVRLYTKGGCKVLISEESQGDKLRWHLSISRADRYPGWDEIKDARYSLLPASVTMAMILPPPEQYVNVHPNCFHLHEIEGEEK
jgi:hypothetical protein